MSHNVSTLGQVFTPAKIVDFMLKLRANNGKALEPSAGDGAFLSELERDAVAIEIDRNLLNDKRALPIDFFEYSISNKFDTIIGNPPYVRHQDIQSTTKDLLPANEFDRRTNLYIFFINKCIEHLNNNGELIFITPRDFIKATSARELNARLYEEGSFTHFYDMGDSPIFKKYSPNCAIWRWQKGRTNRRMRTNGVFRYHNGQIWFGDTASSTLKDFFSVKVGAVSGADNIFTHDKGEILFVCSSTATGGKLKRMIYNKKDRYLYKYKDALLKRKIRKFDETNWWEWGRNYHDRKGARIYVNCKTRKSNPFFVSRVKAYDGSVMALFPNSKMDLDKAAKRLNSVDWEKFGFVCGGRFLFTQKSLENIPIEFSI